jgi:hypothetical protein
VVNASKKMGLIEVLISPVVMESWFYDRHDVDFFLKATADVKRETGEAHIYDHEPSGLRVVSSKPLGPRAVNAAASAYAKERVRERLRAGEDAGEIWASSSYISGATVGRIAKEEGIKLPRGWFSKALAEVEAENTRAVHVLEVLHRERRGGVPERIQ